LRRALVGVLAALALGALFALSSGAGAAQHKFVIWSTAFKPGAALPTRFSCDGADVPPPLLWTKPPDGTQSLALALRDPDAQGGTFTHWLVWGVQPRDTTLPAKSSRVEGQNDYGWSGYAGPCPPPGTRHRYVFELYALDQKPGLKPGSSANDFNSAVRSHVLALAAVTATYRRPKASISQYLVKP
jgi:hypothetical protein